MSKESKDYEKDYTKPELRAELKDKIMAGEAGGKSGEWSARKSQILKREYEKAGGGYKHPGKLTASQKSMKKWNKEKWETSDKKEAIRGDETTRYLPHDVWESLTEKEKKSANRTKESASKTGKQHVANPSSVKKKVKKKTTA
eukprot:TRINITY_DN21584_c0_g1_i1.p1 TRINITY_DN21584_c0_g1~~TRINITY_DN21584_c0_g1_i1.p1  ORF type:complete len:143 (+),score=10.02 TRINITY_DN21584_c0_g1_i1:436-864(+)